jgi:hypothetical protein
MTKKELIKLIRETIEEESYGSELQRISKSYNNSVTDKPKTADKESFNNWIQLGIKLQYITQDDADDIYNKYITKQ